MDKFTCVDDYEEYALKVLPPSVRDYYKSGAGDEITLQWNKEAFRKYVFKISNNKSLFFFILFIF